MDRQQLVRQCDMEVMKMAMLKHEETFRQQVIINKAPTNFALGSSFFFFFTPLLLLLPFIPANGVCYYEVYMNCY